MKKSCLMFVTIVFAILSLVSCNKTKSQNSITDSVDSAGFKELKSKQNDSAGNTGIKFNADSYSEEKPE